MNNPEVFGKFSQSFFEKADKDENGLVDKKELEKVLHDLTEQMKIPKPTKEELEEILSKYDTDKSGNLDRKEFDNFSRYVLEAKLFLSQYK